MAREVAAAETKRFGRAAGLLSVGIGSAGLLTYVYFSLASHVLDKVAYGEVVVLWSAVFVTISVLFRPVEQLLSRTIAERQARGRPIGQPLRVAATIQLALAGGVRGRGARVPGARCRTTSSPETRRSTGSSSPPSSRSRQASSPGAFWPAAGASLCYGALLARRVDRADVVRPGGRRRDRQRADGGRTRDRRRARAQPHGRSARLRGPSLARSRAPATPSALASGESEFTLAAGGGFAAAVLLIMVSEQTLLNAGPLLVRASEGAAAAGFIFNVLMIARAPLVLFQAVATSLLPHLTRLL